LKIIYEKNIVKNYILESGQRAYLSLSLITDMTGLIKKKFKERRYRNNKKTDKILYKQVLIISVRTSMAISVECQKIYLALRQR